MDKKTDESVEFLRLVAWLDANRKQLITVTVAVVAVIAIAGGYVFYKKSHEATASEALSELKLPMTSEQNPVANAADAQSYLQVAQQYPGTHAGARALLIGGGILFDAGKYDQAQAAFDQFLRDYPDDAFASQAMVGVASSLEAQGKLADATSRYDDLIKHHQADSTTPQAKSALARLYVAQNKPEQAVQYYEELARGNNNDTWSAEAGLQLEELLAKYPNLRKTATPVAPSSATVTIPGPSSAN